MAQVAARLRGLGGDNLWIEGRRLAPAELIQALLNTESCWSELVRT